MFTYLADKMIKKKQVYGEKTMSTLKMYLQLAIYGNCQFFSDKGRTIISWRENDLHNDYHMVIKGGTVMLFSRKLWNKDFTLHGRWENVNGFWGILARMRK